MINICLASSVFCSPTKLTIDTKIPKRDNTHSAMKNYSMATKYPMLGNSFER